MNKHTYSKEVLVLHKAHILNLIVRVQDILQMPYYVIYLTIVRKYYRILTVGNDIDTGLESHWLSLMIFVLALFSLR